MKLAACLLLALGGAVALAETTATAEQPQRDERRRLAALMPDQRVTVTVLSNERNPFGEAAQPMRGVPMQAVEAEESRLRAVLGAMPIGGVAGSGDKAVLLMGSMRLKAGDTVPRLLPSQAEQIRVVALSPELVVFGFVERDGKVGDRTFSRSIDMAPAVRFMLPSQVPMTGGGAPGPFGGLQRADGRP